MPVDQSNGHRPTRSYLPAAPGIPAASGRRTGAHAFAGVDWDAVGQLRQQVAERMALWRRGDGAAQDQAGHDVFALGVCQEEVSEYLVDRVRAGATRYSAGEERSLVEAVHAAAFGLGRIQPLIDDPDLENIEVNGFDNVILLYADGRIETGPPVADSDRQLLADLQYWAARAGRSFTTARPHLNLELPGGARLAAQIETVKRPTMTIRLHRVVDTSLRDLVARGAVSQALAQFLQACVLANANLVITGPPGAGKTTLMRALAAAIPPWERYATLESDRELHLDELGRHLRMVSYEAREGSSEQSLDGRPVGQVTLSDLVEVALRGNYSRLLLGEVRGREVTALLEAISTGGKGSFCTIHANSAADAFERIVSLCLTRSGITAELAYRLAAQSLQYIVHVDLVDDSIHAAQPAGAVARRRFVTEVLAVEGIGEFGRPITTRVFASTGHEGRAEPAGHLPRDITRLERAGLDRGWLLRDRASTWTYPTTFPAPPGGGA